MAQTCCEKLALIAKVLLEVEITSPLVVANIGLVLVVLVVLVGVGKAVVLPVGESIA
jgi:hypothetical protein